MALDVFDHLDIVVSGQKGLVRAAFGHGQEAHEVGEPGELRLLELGMLVPVMVDLPGLVGDDEIVAALFDGIHLPGNRFDKVSSRG